MHSAACAATVHVPGGHCFHGQSASGNARQHVGNHYGNIRHDGDNIYYTTNYNGITAATKQTERNRRNEALLDAAYWNDVQRVRALLKAGVDVDYLGRCGRTALFLAVSNGTNHGSIDCVEMLIKAGSNVNSRNRGGFTPLMIAAGFPQPRVVEILLNTPGIDIDAKNAEGDTAIHKAAFYAHPDNIRLLAQHNCNINVRNRKGETPLHRAARRSFLTAPGTVEALVRAGALVTAQDKDGRTPLQQAEYELASSRAIWKSQADVYHKIIECLKKDWT